MPSLPSSGPLSIGTISSFLSNNGCIGYETYSLRNLSAAAGKQTPDGINEFYGYSCGGGPVCNSATFCYDAVNCIGACYPPFGLCADQVLFWVGNLGVGTVLYTSCASGPASDGYYATSNTCYQVSGNGGLIVAANVCPTCFSAQFQFSEISLEAAKCTPEATLTLYWYGTFTSGTFVYQGGCGQPQEILTGYLWGPVGGLSVAEAWAVNTNTISGPFIEPQCSVTACYNYIVTSKGGDFSWIDCCGVIHDEFLGGGDTFCAQFGTVETKDGTYTIGAECEC